MLPCLFTIFAKGNSFRDFTFASLDEEVFPNWVNCSRKKFAPEGANSFL